MKDRKLYIVMVGLPAMGKSTIAARIRDSLMEDRIPCRIFNNGDLRRRLARGDTSYAEFYDPGNREGVALREKFALMNLTRARRYLEGSGCAAIVDATNVSVKRRELILETLSDHPLLFIECVNDEPELLTLSVERKARLPEFAHLSHDQAVESFWERIAYYRHIYTPLADEPNHLRLDSLNHRILDERISCYVPYFDRIRDLLVTDSVRNLFLVRHGETLYNVEGRIGGDSGLTERGQAQAAALAARFRKVRLPYIFTSRMVRTVQTAAPVAEGRPDCSVISLPELDEIHAGVCEHLTYEEIRQNMPEVFARRSEDKYNYVYPGGEGYWTLKDRVYRGLKKALFLSGNAENVMIVGHRAVNRMILSRFLYRREEDVPYIFIPQDRYFHIVSTQIKKLFQLKPYLPG